jgi:3-deoxy-D-manno-octulosonic-acid transferase
VEQVRPVTAIFIKYEFWYFFLKTLSAGGYPVHVVSAIFIPSQAFFSWYGPWFRRKLGYVSSFFVQDEASGKLLQSIGISRYTITGDTRFDRVAAVVAAAKEIPAARAFTNGRPCLVAGSTWPEDEDILLNFIHSGPEDWKYIIAPHEVKPANLNRLISRLERPAVLFSEADTVTLSSCQVLVIDNVGMLSSLYRYAKVAYIGGGFGKGIHNILEAAAYGIPVIFGPGYGKFREACELIRLGGAFPINGKDDLQAIMNQLSDQVKYDEACRIAGSFVKQNTGATVKIVDTLFMTKGQTVLPH